MIKALIIKVEGLAVSGIIEIEAFELHKKILLFATTDVAMFFTDMVMRANSISKIYDLKNFMVRCKLVISVADWKDDKFIGSLIQQIKSTNVPMVSSLKNNFKHNVV